MFTFGTIQEGKDIGGRRRRESCSDLKNLRREGEMGERGVETREDGVG